MTSPFSPDPDQERVLAHRTGALLVTGVAGTGKTAVLVERFARLLEGGADPERVAFVVGSRRARDDARAALLARFAGSLPELRVVTIHGLARHVLNARFGRLDYVEPPELLPATDQFALVQELLSDQDPTAWPAYGHMLGMRAFADEIRQFLSRAQESLLTPEDIEERADKAGLTGWKELARFYREYQDVIDRQGVVDFAALLQRAAQVSGDGELLLDHLVVDDFQDTTLAAEAIVEGLGSPDLVVAGDPDAHVFSFQGMTSVPILRFTERFRARHLRLEQAHRAPHPVSVDAWVALHTSEEHGAAARELRRLHVEEGVPWHDLAVVVRRQGAHVAGLLRALDDAGVPRAVPERGLSLAAEPATFPYVLGLRWLVADHERREELVEQVLTSDLVGLSPATVRGLTRSAQAERGSIAEALDATDGVSDEEAARLVAAREVFADAQRVVTRSVVDAFRILWERLPCSSRLVAAAATSGDARRELDAVVTFSGVVAEAGASPDPSTAAFLETLDAGEAGPGYVSPEHGAPEAVSVLTAHGASGREFDTVVIAGAVEGNFPSLARPEPMFDLAALERPVTRSERNRVRLEDERRLFRSVIGRARHRVVLVGADTHAHEDALSTRSRFADELGAGWSPVPTGPFDEPVSVREAAATWRRTLADPSIAAIQRLAALDGLVALGADPRRWWFQRGWTDTGRPLHDELRLSYSKLSTLDNCELQHVFADELGLGRAAGYQAWVGKTVHRLIEDCEGGVVPRELDAILAEVDARWRPGEFPSRAVSEAFRREVRERMMPNWFQAFAGGLALAVERSFEFEFDGVTIAGVIDRIGPLASGGTRITDYKTGKAENAGKPEESLQLGIYWLAVQRCEDLAPFRPVRAVELAFLKGSWRNRYFKEEQDAYESKTWQVSASKEEAYQAAVRQALSDLIAREKELVASETYRPNPNANCRFCDFRTLCPLYPEGASALERAEGVRA